MFPDLRHNLKSSGLLLYECSISYSTLKRSFAPRILTTTSAPRDDTGDTASKRTTSEETKRRRCEDILLEQEWVCKFGCDQLPSQRGTRNQLAAHYRIFLLNGNNKVILSVEQWKCKYGCDQLPPTPGNKRQLAYHHKVSCPQNKKRTENTIVESDKNGQDGEEDIGMEPNEAAADVIMA